MSEDLAGSLGATEYAFACRTLGLPADDRLSPTQRYEAVPRWWNPLLAAMPPAVFRLRRWVDRGRENIENVPAARAALIRSTTVFATPEARAEIEVVLDALPPPTLAHVNANVAINCIGGRVGGRLVPLIIKAEADEVQSIDVEWNADPATFRGIVAHELGHAWTCGAPTVVSLGEGIVAITGALTEEQLEAAAQHREAYVSIAKIAGRVEEVARPDMQRERIACRLAALWGFGGDGAAAEQQARRALLDVEREAIEALLKVEQRSESEPT